MSTTTRVAEVVAMAVGGSVSLAMAYRIWTRIDADRLLDPSEATLLLIGLAALVLPSIESIKTPFGEFRRQLQAATALAKREVEQVAEAKKEEVTEIAKEASAVTLASPDAPPEGSTDAQPRAPASARVVRRGRLDELEAALPPPIHADDPNKGRFGGRNEANGKRLTATVKALVSGWYEVTLDVASTTAAPLTGPVRLFLHPTFPQPVTTLEPGPYGVRARVNAWGSFTVGAICSDGTELELDLANETLVPHPFVDFRSR